MRRERSSPESQLPGQEERLARVVLTREVGRFRVGIEQGIGLAPTGVKRGSAKVEIVSQGLKIQT